jgi:hypothetical protein
VQGKHSLPKSRRNLEGGLHISSRTKLANDRAMQLIRVQEALKIVLAVLIIYATYSSIQNPAIVEAIQKMAVSFELDMKAK